jgi:histidinol-phosphate aminotransferase
VPASPVPPFKLRAVPSTLAEIAETFFKPAVRDIVPYEPGKPVEEVQRELGLERVIKLASNEGPFGPFPEALDALAEAAPELNRYPDGGGYRLRAALAERHEVRFEEIALGAGADGVVDCLSQVSLDHGDEVVCGWPSFPSYVIGARKLGAVPRLIPLRDGRYDLEAMLEAITERTKLVYVCLPNNPTGTTNSRAELDEYFERVPEHVLTVLDQAYFEYVDDPDYPDGSEEYLKRGLRVVVLRTFSKIFGLAGLRVGYGLAPAEVVTAIGKVRRAFDITAPAQVAAVASLAAPGVDGELERRRRVNAEGRPAIEAALRERGFEPAGPAVANFVFAEVGDDSRPLFEQLLQEGVIVRPTAGFGAPGGIRVTVGTPDENAFFREALGRVLAHAGT